MPAVCFMDVPCDTARDFLDALDVTRDHWALRDEVFWIFRGQADAQWGLVPSAWRPAGQAMLEQTVGWGVEIVKREVQTRYAAPAAASIAAAIIQTNAEFFGVRDFVTIADDIGLPIPEGAIPSERNAPFPKFRDTLELTDQWWDSLIQPSASFALAQHHGVPTRLLDWTSNSMVAAFFAAEDALALSNAANVERSGSLAVWAVQRLALDLHGHVKVLTCPRFENSFLHAQQGVFTYDRTANRHFLDNGHWPDLADSLSETGLPDGPDFFRKITLPASEAENLLQLLQRLRISRAHLMPTYDNVAKTALVRWRWREPMAREVSDLMLRSS